MIPLLLATIITLIIATFNIESSFKILIFFLAFTYSLYGFNKIIYELLKNDYKIHTSTINNENIIRKYNIVDGYYVVIIREGKKDIKCNVTDIFYQKNRRLNNTSIKVPSIRKILPNYSWVWLTWPNLWFNKVNKWKYDKSKQIIISKRDLENLIY
jgi:hypothetical protein